MRGRRLQSPDLHVDGVPDFLARVVEELFADAEREHPPPAGVVFEE